MQWKDIPLMKRRGDLAILAFFLVNILFITYIVDIEQLIIPDPAHFTYPIWPPHAAVDAIHWWGYTFDPALIARPVWWKVTIWIDALFFGPFYVVAIYAYLKSKEWIRIPSIIYSSVMLTNVAVILGEEMFGPHATPDLPVVLLANLPWLLVPVYIIYRMWRYSHPFTQMVAPSDMHTSVPNTQTSRATVRKVKPRSTAASFRYKYGPWAMVAGASAGLGAEYATQLAAEGLNLVLIARRADLVTQLSERLRTEYPIQVRPLTIDLAQADAASLIAAQTLDLEIGMLVYDAALSAVGPFFSQPLETHLREIDTNCRTPLMLAYILGQRMATRQRGGIVLMSSLSATQGTPLISNYAATKAYNLVLGEGLWDELRDQGIDVVACCAGSTDTPNYRASAPARNFSSVMAPSSVVAETFAALGRNPSVVPGRSNRLAAFVMRRLLSRRLAVTMMGRTLRGMYSSPNR